LIISTLYEQVFDTSRTNFCGPAESDGLGLVRSRSPRLATALHVAANGGGVLLGHAGGRDQF
jgi:hypothetical protein